MRGIDILKGAFALLDEDISDIDASKRTAALGFINHIIVDLKLGRPIKNLNEEVKAGGELSSALIYGTAMHLAAAQGNGARQSYFTRLYNRKRTLAGHNDSRRDVLPVSCS